MTCRCKVVNHVDIVDKPSWRRNSKSESTSGRGPGAFEEEQGPEWLLRGRKGNIIEEVRY